MFEQIERGARIELMALYEDFISKDDESMENRALNHNFFGDGDVLSKEVKEAISGATTMGIGELKVSTAKEILEKLESTNDKWFKDSSELRKLVETEKLNQRKEK